jgi:hypothetical protein
MSDYVITMTSENYQELEEFKLLICFIIGTRGDIP